MTAKELIDELQKVAPDTEIIGGMWNGRTNTYKVIDYAHVFLFDEVCNDFFGTPGSFDNSLLKIKSKEVVYLGSEFEVSDERVLTDRSTLWQMRKVLRSQDSKAEKMERIYKMLTEFDKGDFKTLAYKKATKL